ncbi:MAG: membrane protein insertase YidC [Clostridia bacterium]|jgi:YidC/Oxa1 family membrane protein insertase|nr:membrane protein insertase YidC [Clostridia bacterium]MBP8634368.1 membrane protein insertase YidC [Clostridia bacterium]CDC06699.1 membrane protein insertase YidC/Oxa1 family [Clostridium sp. CAG:343]HCF34291.1 membrane protein insertase YidC [Clostridiales bacterium]
MFEFFANIFGYLLQFLYTLVNNYGLAIILFTLIIKLLLLPLSIKQQKTMKKSSELQEKVKVMQFKYKNDPEKLNKEMMNLYKTENVSPFSGCLTSIIQMLLLLSIFYLVRSPLTFMEKIPQENINTYIQQLKDEGKVISNVYPEIDLIRETELLKEKNPEDQFIEKTNIKMNFLGLDLSKIPQQNMTDYTVYIIPVLYILSSFISIRITTAKQQKDKEDKKSKNIDGNTGKEIEEENNEMDAVMQTNKMMSWFVPIMSISIAFIAPLGLALYWLISNILMIAERLIIDKVVKS